MKLIWFTIRILLCILIAYSCERERKKDQGLLLITDFPVKEKLFSQDLFPTPEIATPYLIDVVDSFLIVNGLASNNGWVSFYNITTNKYLKSIVSRGKGPEESYLISSVGKLGSKLYLHDFSRVILLDEDDLYANSDVGYNALALTSSLTTNSKGVRNYYYQYLESISENRFVAMNSLNLGIGRFSTFNAKLELMRQFGSYSHFDSSKYPLNDHFVVRTLSKVFNGTLHALNDSQFVAKTNKAAILDIYNIHKDTPVRSIVAPSQEYPVEFIQHNDKIFRQANFTGGYFDLEVADNKIYALYSEIQYKGLTPASTVHVYDNNGAAIAKLELDRKVNCIAIHNNKIVSYHPYYDKEIKSEVYKLISFPIPERVINFSK